MPSDDLMTTALDLVTRPAKDFQSVLATAVDEVRTFLEVHRPAEVNPTNRLHAELGHFASNRIDLDRFAALLTKKNELDPHVADVVQRALDVFLELLRREDRLFHVAVGPSESLASAVRRAFADVGRVSGAGRVVELCRRGKYDEGEHASLLQSFPYDRWRSPERRIAPPLIVAVPGDRLQVGGLADFLDAAQRIILVVEGPCPPAALVRLVTPGTLVLQRTSVDALDALSAFDGPAVAAIVPEGAAEFIHDPRAGDAVWTCLDVMSVPDEVPSAPLGGISVFQQREELGLLRQLASPPIAAPSVARETVEAGAGAGGSSPQADPVDKLAAWLLSQAGVSDDS
jgi:hypothetical protein